MTLPVAYDPDTLLIPGTLPPAYGNGWAIPGQLQPAYGNDGLVFNNPSIAFDSRITFTRSTTANRFNSSGTLTSTAIDVARASANQDYNPSTLAARGFLIEAGATNSLRNNTMQGAAAASPGTAPTRWAVTTTGGVFTRTITAISTESGIEYIEIRYQASGSGTATIQFEEGNFIAASSGQTWTNSAFVKLTGGSLTNISEVRLGISENDSGGSFLAGNTTAFTPTSAGLATQRRTHIRTLNNASTAFVVSTAQIVFTGAGDITLRIGLPQLEQNAFATSVIRTSSAAVARGADNASILSLPSIGFSATQGFVYAEVMLEGVGTSNYPGVITFDDGTANNAIALLIADAENDRASIQVYTGGVFQNETRPAVAFTANTLFKVAASWSNNSLRCAVNGTAATQVTSGVTLPTVNRMRIGKGRGGGANTDLNGWLPRITYGPQHLTTSQLQSMTA